MIFIKPIGCKFSKKNDVFCVFTEIYSRKEKNNELKKGKNLAYLLF